MSNFDMILIHIGILVYPVKDSTERDKVFSKYRCFDLIWDPKYIPKNKTKPKKQKQKKQNKTKNRSLTTDILLHPILQTDYNISIVRTVNGG